MIRINIISLLLSSSLMANVIDLGSIEVEGEVRKPLIHYTGSELSLKDQLKSSIANLNNSFKSELINENSTQIENIDFNTNKLKLDSHTHKWQNLSQKGGF